MLTTMRDSSLQCHWCKLGNGKLLYCHKCAFLSCSGCTEEVEVVTQYCSTCKKELNSEYCGDCGCETQQIRKETKICCSNCGGTELNDPELIVNNLPSDYFSALSEIKDIQPSLDETYRSFEFFITIVRLCRIGGLMAFPQIEEQLNRCSTALKFINQRSIDQLMKVRQEALFDVRNINYFSGVDINSYRSAERIIINTSDLIKDLIEMIEHWLEEVNIELNKLYTLADPLRRHYELLSKVKRFLPEGIYNVAAVIPAVSTQIKHKKETLRFIGFIIFAEEELVFLPQQAVEERNKEKIILAKRIPYELIINHNKEHSSLKGNQLTIKILKGNVKINAPLNAISGIEAYLKLIKGNHDFTIGSAKEILKIEAEAADRNTYRNATDKFVEIFRERLFGKGPANFNEPNSNLSLSTLKKELLELKRKTNDLDTRASNLQVDPENYSDFRHQINDSISSIQSNFDKLSGHFNPNYNVRKWINEDQEDKSNFFDNDPNLDKF